MGRKATEVCMRSGISDMLSAIVSSVPEIQLELDIHCTELAERSADVKLAPVAVPDKSGGYMDISMFEAGAMPSFFQISETDISIRMALERSQNGTLDSIQADASYLSRYGFVQKNTCCADIRIVPVPNVTERMRDRYEG